MSIVKLAITASEVGVLGTSIPFVGGLVKGLSTPNAENMKFDKSVGIGAAIGLVPGAYYATGGPNWALPFMAGAGAVAGASANIGARMGRAFRNRKKKK